MIAEEDPKYDLTVQCPVGTRVRLSEQGKLLHRAHQTHLLDREGTVINYARKGKCVIVHWDGVKKVSSSYVYHPSLLTLARPAEFLRELATHQS